MKTKIKTIVLFFAAVLTVSCATQTNEEQQVQEAAETNETNEVTTISGTVRAIENGKDGYTASVETANGETYNAVISIVNLGGPENFSRLKIGDKVRLQGLAFVVNETKQLVVDKIISVETTRTGLLISEDAFRGIRVGDDIAQHSDYIQKQQLRTGEGEFEIYRIKDFNNNPAGFFYPDSKDENKVGSITVESPKAATAEGIRVGSTFGELLKKLPELEVHGSEIESRTHAMFKNLSYRLNIANVEYDVAVEKIPASTEITQIIIGR